PARERVRTGSKALAAPMWRPERSRGNVRGGRTCPARWRAAFWKQATCSGWLSRLEMVLNTRYTRVNSPGAIAVAMSPRTTGMVASSTLVRNYRSSGGQLDVGNADTALAQRDRQPTGAD